MALIEYEVDGRVGVITLNRPGQHNAQNAELLKELDEAFDRAVEDREIRVIVLKANGKHFSAGHDLAPQGEPWSSMFDDVDVNGLLQMYRWELKHYFGYSKKWRDLPKPTIAAVQGACIAGGLMLAWPCDLIIAADDARFSDPVIRMGIGGVEYHGHTWELGPRKAKELLWTAGSLNAQEALELGMVNRVVPRDGLTEATLALARQIAQMHPHALLQTKRMVNQTVNAQGFNVAIEAAFDIHSLGHANAQAISGRPALTGLAAMAEAGRKEEGAQD